jgi:hypothetical protein
MLFGMAIGRMHMMLMLGLAHQVDRAVGTFLRGTEPRRAEPVCGHPAWPGSGSTSSAMTCSSSVGITKAATRLDGVLMISAFRSLAAAPGRPED